MVVEQALRTVADPNGPGPATAAVDSYCPVSAGGVAAEWVECCIATDGQPTLVLFLGTGHGAGALERGRSAATALALTTGGRVLVVACRPGSDSDHRAAVASGLTAYEWLLGEGCDLTTTALAGRATDKCLVTAITLEAGSRGLPLPARGRVLLSGSNATPAWEFGATRLASATSSPAFG